MTQKCNEALRLQNQLCFPLYACSREIIKKYHPLLEQADLTYTQYVTMMVLWEKKTISVKELGKRLYLDSGTLTPVLKALEAKGFLTRQRSHEDERKLIVSVTEKGEALTDTVASVPEQVGCQVNLTPEEAAMLYGLLYKMLGGMTEAESRGK